LEPCGAGVPQTVMTVSVAIVAAVHWYSPWSMGAARGPRR
jgi:hypothetical protein